MDQSLALPDMRVFWLFLLCWTTPCWAAQDSNAPGPRPNVLWITIDDAGPDFGCYGRDVAATPRLDALAAGGQRFERCWSTSPIGSPSRSAWMTGCSPQSSGSQHHRSSNALPEPIRPITALLRDAGYSITSLPLTRQRPGDFAAGKQVADGRLGTLTGTLRQDYNFARGTRLFGAWDKRDPEAPFFATVDLSSSKIGAASTAAHTWAEATGNVVDPSKLTLPAFWVDSPELRASYAQYFEGLALLDAEVGCVLDWLADQGLAETTWVFLVSDHGPSFARYKQWCYEGGLHVPLLVSGPGLLPAVRPELVSTVDLAASTLAACGLAVPAWMEGRDLFQAGAPPRRLIFAGRDRCDETEDRVRVVRGERYSLIHNMRPDLAWIGRNTYATQRMPGIAPLLEGRAAAALTPAQSLFAANSKPEWELYDLEIDPQQLVNLAGRAETKAVEIRLREALVAWTAQVDENNTYPEPANDIFPDKVRESVLAKRAPEPEPKPSAEPESGHRRLGPNVVMILADDLGYGDIGCYGQAKIQTPHLDRLAANGARFSQAYSGHAVCAPARAVLLTGQHTGHAPIRNNSPWASQKNPEGEGQEPLPADQAGMARWFQSFGVPTGCFGKWGLGGPRTSGHPTQQGFDTFFGYLGQKQAHDHYPAHLWSNAERVALNNPGFVPAERWASAPKDPEAYRAFHGDDYAPDLILEEALAFVGRNAGQQFFLFFPSTIPHAALQVPGDAIEPYASAGWDAGPYLGDQGYLPHPTPRAAYAAMVSRLDRDVGLLLERLEKLGLDEDTLVIFASDNGPAGNGGCDPEFFASTAGPIGSLAREGGRLRGGKGSLYEGGIRVPMIISWPGKVAAGGVVEQVVGFQDLWPTIAEVLDQPLPPGLDGISFAPTLLGGDESAHPVPLYWESGRSQALRMGDWKLVRKVGSQGRVQPELFNLSKDPGETNNLAQAAPEELARLIALARAARRPSATFPSPFDSGL